MMQISPVSHPSNDWKEYASSLGSFVEQVNLKNLPWQADNYIASDSRHSINLAQSEVEHNVFDLEDPIFILAL